MKVAIYVRRSTTKQVHSVDRQKLEARALAARNGWEVVAEYVDSASASTLALRDRPQGARLLADAERGRFEGIVAYQRDRLFRQVTDSVITLALLSGWGIRLFFTQEADVGDSEMLAVVEYMRALVSALESQKTGERRAQQ